MIVELNPRWAAFERVVERTRSGVVSELTTPVAELPTQEFITEGTVRAAMLTKALSLKEHGDDGVRLERRAVKGGNSQQISFELRWDYRQGEWPNTMRCREIGIHFYTSVRDGVQEVRYSYNTEESMVYAKASDAYYDLPSLPRLSIGDQISALVQTSTVHVPDMHYEDERHGSYTSHGAAVAWERIV